MEEFLGISQNLMNLIATKEECSYEFDFNFENHVVLASMFLALEPELELVREKAVPDFVTEEEFWRNFFFQIERIN